MTYFEKHLFQNFKLSIILLPLLFFSACGNPFNIEPVDIAATAETGGSNPPVLLSVEKVYPANGAAWLKYISGSSGTNLFDRNDVDCAGTETGSLNACIHGGDKLKVVLSDYSNCNNLTMQDSLGVFIWSCFPGTGHVIFYSTGFNENKGMSDLIDFAASDWKTMNVSLYESAVLKNQSAPAKWWSNISNPIVVLPDSSTSTQTITGFSAGTILVLTANQVSHGYVIDQDSVAVVIQPGVALSLNAGVAQNCEYGIGETGTPNSRALFCIGGQKYLWIEGELNDPSHVSDPLIDFVGTKFSQLNKVRINQGPDGNVIFSMNSSYNRIFDLKSQNSNGTWAGLDFYGSDYNFFYDIRMANNTVANFWPFLLLNGDSDFNIVSKATFSQNNQNTIAIYGTNNVATDIFNTSSSRVIVGGDKNTVSHITSYAMGNAGVVITPAFAETASYNTVNQTLGSDNYFGFGVVDSTNSFISQTAIFTTYNYSPGLYLSGTSDNQFSNALLMSNSTHPNNCDVTGGANPGLIDGTCANQGLSDAVLRTYDEMVVVSPIKGAIGADDISNNSDNGSGVAVANTITDFLNFENRFRAWAKAGDVGLCQAADNCSIVDLRLKVTDMIFRNTSNDGQTQNAAFVAGAACPAAIDGNKTITSQADVPQTFLMNAIEIFQDGIGDDDGLCETGEACIYSPNFGAYQGHGDYSTSGTCDFQNGTVSNVKMYAYPINGI